MSTKGISDRYTRQFAIIITSVFVISLALAYIAKIYTEVDIPAVIFSGIINIVVSVFSFVLITGSIESGNQKFMIFSFGSIVARLFIMIIVILAGLLLFKFNKISFIFAVLFFYFLFLFIETVLLVKKVNKKKESLS
ncbi:MAG: hypothetical protein MUE56_07695 [Ignavibacteria bacterium]|jgi:hypothetical protein|nr:hypothetical protein [Ignavibacteria bacterium]